MSLKEREEIRMEKGRTRGSRDKGRTRGSGDKGRTEERLTLRKRIRVVIIINK